MTRPLVRVVILTDEGTKAFTAELAAYDGTLPPPPPPPPTNPFWSDPFWSDPFWSDAR